MKHKIVNLDVLIPFLDYFVVNLLYLFILFLFSLMVHVFFVSRFSLSRP